MESRVQLEAPTSLRDMVVRQLRSDIVSGRSAPGTLYSAPSLAEEIGISTTPVREALLDLSRSGLVVPMRNRGFRVAGTSLDELNNLFAMRELLERFAVTTLAERTPPDAPGLRRMADAIAAAVEREDVPAYVDADRAFHEELVTQAGNPLLMEMRDAMRLYGIDSTAGRKRQSASVAEHHALVDLAAAGKADEAAALMSRHILDWKPIFTAAMPVNDKDKWQRAPISSPGASPR